MTSVNISLSIRSHHAALDRMVMMRNCGREESTRAESDCRWDADNLSMSAESARWVHQPAAGTDAATSAMEHGCDISTVGSYERNVETRKCDENKAYDARESDLVAAQERLVPAVKFSEHVGGYFLRGVRGDEESAHV